MSDCETSVGFGLTVSTHQDGTLQAAYLRISNQPVVDTEEVIDSVLMLDLDADQHPVGIEILAPVSSAKVLALADRLDPGQRLAFYEFVKSFTTPALLTPSA